MYSRNKCYYGLARTDIPLEESCHRMRLLHILEYLEEDDLLLVGKCEWESVDKSLDEFSIQRCRWSKSLSLFQELVFFLHSSQLKLEEFLISESSLGSLKGLHRIRKVDISYGISAMRESFLGSDFFRNPIGKTLDISSEEYHLVTDPSTRDIIHVTIARHDLLSFLSIVLDLGRRK